MNATQPFNTLNQINECPICMDVIEGVCNKVVTECGHAFHCSCLMKNASHNGFGCPYCRTAMAETPAAEEDDEYDEDNEDDEEESIFDEDVLTGFRMFHQRINGEEVEEEAPEEWESVAESEEEEEEEEETMPDSVYISQKLVERGITFDDLVKSLLVAEHSNFGSHYSDYERRSSEIYGQFRAAISQFRPEQIRTVASNTDSASVAVTIPEVASNSASNSTIPEVAEAKTVSVVRRREFMNHV